jgi:hypothetical protein
VRQTIFFIATKPVLYQDEFAIRVSNPDFHYNTSRIRAGWDFLSGLNNTNGFSMSSRRWGVNKRFSSMNNDGSPIK